MTCSDYRDNVAARCKSCSARRRFYKWLFQSY
ncbi:MAG: hypothetical protein J0H87_07125 [Holosporales bacterium]|nr:hypothetical protein [Holosporales bacterium]